MTRDSDTPLPSDPAQAEILAFLKTIAKEELELTDEEIAVITMDTPLVEGLQLDSVAQVVLITSIEEHYDFEFEFEDREQLNTVRDLVEMIQQRLAAASGQA